MLEKLPSHSLAFSFNDISQIRPKDSKLSANSVIFRQRSLLRSKTEIGDEGAGYLPLLKPGKSPQLGQKSQPASDNHSNFISLQNLVQQKNSNLKKLSFLKQQVSNENNNLRNLNKRQFINSIEQLLLEKKSRTNVLVCRKNNCQSHQDLSAQPCAKPAPMVKKRQTESGPQGVDEYEQEKHREMLKSRGEWRLQLSQTKMDYIHNYLIGTYGLLEVPQRTPLAISVFNDNFKKLGPLFRKRVNLKCETSLQNPLYKS